MGVDAVFAWLAEFFDQQFLNLLFATGLLFIAMFVTWWVYKKLSTRNLFSLFSASKLRAEPGFEDYLVYLLKYFFLFPILTFAGFLIFALSLFLLVKPGDAATEANVLFIAIIIVSAIRVAAYVNEHMAEDLAKLVPLSMLGVVLMRPADAATGVTFGHILSFIRLIPSVLKYLLFIAILEFFLRGGTWLFIHLRDDETDRPS